MASDKDYLLENIAMLQTSGMDLGTSLESIKSEIKNQSIRAKIDQMSKSMLSGASFWKSIELTKLFPAYIISLIRIGEESGKLAENLKIVITQQSRERELKSRVQSALMYPLFVFGLTIIVGVGIAWFILPRLSTVFSGLDIELPLITKILIGAGAFLGKYGIFVVPLIVALLGAMVYLLFINPKTKHIGEEILLRLPIFSRLIKEVEISRMGFLLGTLLGSGIPVIEAFESLVSASTSQTYQKFYRFLKQKVTEGNSIQKSLATYPSVHKLVPGPVLQMIATAEKSGHLAETFSKIGEIYEEKTTTTTKNLSVLLEPILLVIVWLGVVAVALAVILPIYSLIGGINR